MRDAEADRMTPRSVASSAGDVVGRPGTDGCAQQHSVLLRPVEVHGSGGHVQEAADGKAVGCSPVELGPVAQSQLAACDNKMRSGDVRVGCVPHTCRDEEGVREGDTGLT